MMFGHPAAHEHPYPGCSFVARVDFLFGKRQFKAGEDFDWRALGLQEHQAVALWRSDHLLVAAQPKPRRQRPPRTAQE